VLKNTDAYMSSYARTSVIFMITHAEKLITELKKYEKKKFKMTDDI
jgi:predicted ATPase